MQTYQNRSTPSSGLTGRCRLSAALLSLIYGIFPSSAQVITCQTPAPFKNPALSDTATGWSGTTDTVTAKNQFAVGDIDGDGNDELITITKGQIQIWRWIQTGWSTGGLISSSRIASDFGQHYNPESEAYIRNTHIAFGPTTIRLADVDGGGQKDIVVHVENSFDQLPTFRLHYDRELVYKYDKSLSIWTLLTSYVAHSEQDNLQVYSFGTSTWFKAHKTDAQDTRLWFNYATNQIDAAKFVNGSWTAVPAARPPSNPNPYACLQTRGNCVAFADLAGDGNAAMIYLGYDGKTYILPSTAQKLFGGAPIASRIPAVPITPPRNTSTVTSVNDTTTQGWMMGDIDGDGKDELFFPTPDGALHAYYWDTGLNDFAAFADPAGVFPFLVIPDGFLLPSLTIAPGAINSSGGKNHGIAVIGNVGIYFLQFTNSGGKHTFLHASTFEGTPVIDTAISPTAGFTKGYTGFFRLALEGQTVVMLARSAQGVVNRVPGGDKFADPSTLTDRGYPPYTSSQMRAYQYISGKATGNADIRSLYPDPAVPWAYFQYKVETLPVPPATAGVSAADFASVQNQTIDELTALQSTNAFFGVTGQILTNTYLVKDAALSEITGALGLSSQPNVTGNVLNAVTTALGGLGSLASVASSIIPLTESATELAKLSNQLSLGSNLSYLLGAITGDISTYTASSAPDLATGSYSLKTALDDDALAAATANGCHQSAALSDWSQSKYISDGIVTGAIPIDLEIQQAIIVASQGLFRLNIWQALAPSKWSTLSVEKLTPCGNCLFQGAPSYPAADSFQVSASCKVVGNRNVSLLLEDPATHNYPNLTALNALFASPPGGLGVKPADLFTGNYNWSFPYGGVDLSFTFNTGYATLDCSNWQTLSPQVTPNWQPRSPQATPDLRQAAESLSFDSREPFRTTARPDASRTAHRGREIEADGFETARSADGISRSRVFSSSASQILRSAAVGNLAIVERVHRPFPAARRREFWGQRNLNGGIH